MKKYFLTIALTGLFTAAQTQMPPAAVITDTVEWRMLAPTVELPGTVVSRHDARLAAEVSANLEWIVEVGTAVQRGDVLARLENTRFRLWLLEAESRVARERARVVFLRAERVRLEQLAASNLSAKSQFVQVVSDLAVAESDAAIAEAQLQQARVDMQRTEIAAPFSGIVTERLRSIGERLDSGDVVIRLVDPDALEVIARAPLNAVHFVAAGDSLAMHNDFRRGQGKVRTIVPFGDPQSHMFELRLNADAQGWTVGESIRLAMPTAARRQVLAVPRDALILRRAGVSVFKVLADSTVAQVRVVTGVGDDTHIEVVGDLAAGDAVVIRGAERLHEGASVAAAMPDAATTSATTNAATNATTSSAAAQ